MAAFDLDIPAEIREDIEVELYDESSVLLLGNVGDDQATWGRLDGVAANYASRHLTFSASGSFRVEVYGTVDEEGTPVTLRRVRHLATLFVGAFAPFTWRTTRMHALYIGAWSLEAGGTFDVFVSEEMRFAE